jgi:hypothetical protein
MARRRRGSHQSPPRLLGQPIGREIAELKDEREPEQAARFARQRQLPVALSSNVRCIRWACPGSDRGDDPELRSDTPGCELQTPLTQTGGAITFRAASLHEIRLGRIKATIWENVTETGTRHNVSAGQQWPLVLPLRRVA